MITAFLSNLESIFAWVLEASWQASVLVVLVLLLQITLRGRLNPRWYHALWLLVILRLVLPTLPESALSLFQFSPHAPPVITQSVTEPIFITTAPAQDAALFCLHCTRHYLAQRCIRTFRRHLDGQQPLCPPCQECHGHRRSSPSRNRLRR
jgi:hypothetical protein